MFRNSESKITKKLLCSICNHELQVPEHHGNPMKWILDGSFRKKELFRCEVCGCSKEIPSHCDVTMLYFEEDDDDHASN